MKTTTVTPEQIDERCLQLIAAMDRGGDGWLVDAVDCAALIHLVGIGCKGLGMPLPSVLQRVIDEWNDLPDTMDIRARMGRST